MKKLLYLLLPFVFWSCSDNDDKSEPENYFTAYPKGFFVSTMNGIDTIKFEYKNNQVTKRIGDWIGAGSDDLWFISLFSKSLETNINYVDNKAILTRFTKIENEKYPNDIQTYTLDNNQISQAIYTYENRSNYEEKYVYTYKNNQINYIDLFVTDRYYTNDLRSRRDFYFNKDKNLDSVVYREAIHDLDINSFPPYIDYKNKEREVTVFSNYDQSQNPYQKLGIFTEWYNQSLSKNNFRKTEKIKYDINGDIPFANRISYWEYVYVDGEVKVLK